MGIVIHHEDDFQWAFSVSRREGLRTGAVILQFPFKPLAVLHTPRLRLTYEPRIPFWMWNVASNDRRGSRRGSRTRMTPS